MTVSLTGADPITSAAKAAAAKPLLAFAIVAVALLALASIPATARVAIWIAAIILLLQVLAIVRGGGPAPASPSSPSTPQPPY
jgi:hypothetical protein